MIRLPQLRGRSTRWWAAFLLVAATVLLLLSEVAARLAGVGDFSLYDSDPVVGYIPAPHQQGAFLGRYGWAFNDRSMGVMQPYTPRPGDILLVGDSLVMGRNAMDQPARLGPQLEEQTGCTVWPLAAGSWGLRNELAAITRDSGLSVPQTLVLVLNSEDFSTPSVWRSELTHPRSKPLSVLTYALRRRFFGPKDEPLPLPEDPRWRTDLDAFLAGYPGRVIAVAYPKADELGSSASPIPALPQRIARLELRGAPGWTAADYADSIHPTAAGNAELATFIAATLPQCTK